ncbi:MAG: HAD family hydrolase [Bacteroidales bacterium]
MIGNINNILFDLDGTLTDPKQGIVNSILYALEKMGIQENYISELGSFIGPPLHDSFAKRYNLTAEHTDMAVGYYREYFSEKGIFENKIYDGINELLASLSFMNYQLFVATSKPTVYATKILEHFKLNCYFKAVVGSHPDNTRTSKTEIISHIVSAFGLQASKSAMIGDRKYDIVGAKNNSVNAIGVTFGYGSLEELIASNPDYIVNNISEIGSLFSQKSNN